MQKKAQNNRTKVQPTPAVRNGLCLHYVITLNLIAMTIPDYISCAALVCSTERLRQRSRNFRNALWNLDVTMQKVAVFSFCYSVEIDSLTTQSYLLQNTATKIKFSFNLTNTGRINVVHHFPLSFSQTIRLLQYIQ